MKKNLYSNFSNIIYILFVIATIISMIIVYKDIKNAFTIKFVIGYVIFVFLFIVYTIFSTVLNIRKLKRSEIRNRIVKFIIIFIVLSSLSYGSDYIFRPSKIDLSRTFSISSGLAFGITFFDLVFFKKMKQE